MGLYNVYFQGTKKVVLSDKINSYDNMFHKLLQIVAICKERRFSFFLNT